MWLWGTFDLTSFRSAEPCDLAIRPIVSSSDGPCEGRYFGCRNYRDQDRAARSARPTDCERIGAWSRRRHLQLSSVDVAGLFHVAGEHHCLPRQQDAARNATDLYSHDLELMDRKEKRAS